MWRFLFGFTMLTVILLGPAAAQQAPGSGPSPEDIDKKRQEEALDRQYKSSLKRIKGENAPQRVDPWADIRSTTPTTTTKR